MDPAHLGQEAHAAWISEAPRTAVVQESQGVIKAAARLVKSRIGGVDSAVTKVQPCSPLSVTCRITRQPSEFHSAPGRNRALVRPLSSTQAGFGPGMGRNWCISLSGENDAKTY